MTTKICSKCGRELSVDNFYKHSKMLDGHLNQCKDCVKKRVAKHREQNIEQIREYDRQRGHDPKRQKIRSKITAKRRKEVDGYQRCHNAILRAVRRGEIQRSNTCQICGKQCKTEAHHNDYSKTKEVIWLCPACHKEYHLGKSKKAEQVRKIVDMMLSIKDIS